MEIVPGVQIEGPTLWIAQRKTLLLTDLHIGYEEAFMKEGIALPRIQLHQMKKQLEVLFLHLPIEQVIILGDLKHEFGTISKQEWEETFAFVEFLIHHMQHYTHQPSLILLKGNHDTILAPLINKTTIKRYLQLTSTYQLGDIFLTHGDKIVPIPSTITTIIIGHEHPAITLSDTKRREKYKCYLKTQYQNKNLIVMPSFSQLSEGTDITKEQILSPYLKSAPAPDIYVLGDKEVYYFGNLTSLGIQWSTKTTQ